MELDSLHPSITAHRAGAKLGPENSLTALRRAIGPGVSHAEIDAQLSSDGHVVIAHDADLKRLSGSDRVVTEDTLARLREVELAGREHLSTLEEFIAAARGRIMLNIELKDYGSAADLPARVVEVLRAKDFLSQAVISSSSPALLHEVRRLEPKIPLGLVLAEGELAADYSFEFISAHYEIVTRRLIRKAHRKGREVHAWTVNDRHAMLRLFALGVDNVITDDPALAKEALSRFRRTGPVGRWMLRWKRR